MKSNKCGRLIALFMLTLVLAVAFTVTASATTTDVLDIDAISHDGECGNVSISWDEVSDADYYIVYLDGIHVAYTYKTSYSFTDFVVGENHTFRVVARKGNQVSADGEIVVSATHNYTSVVTLPDCVNGGYTTYTCDCDYTYVGDNVDPLGHTWIDATCITLKTCSVCSATEGNLDTDNHAQAPVWTVRDNYAHQSDYPCCGESRVGINVHTWENGKCTVCDWDCVHFGGEANCLEAAVCENCGEHYGSKNPTNHTSNKDVWSATETHHSSVYECCGADKVASEPHNWVGGTCDVCGYACTHTNTHWNTTKLEHSSVCDECGETLSTNPHGWTDGVCSTCSYACVHESTDDGDCTTAVNCSICGKETTPAGVHTPEADDGDCTTEVKCLYCGTVTTPAKNHTPEADDGNCTTAVKCTQCGTITTPAKNHTPEADDGDCTTAVNCTVCGTVTTPAQADHTPETDDGDCTTAVNCTVCGKEVTPAKNHTPAADDNDCTTAVNCTVCGKEVIPAKPHTPEADDNDCTTALNCTVCGKVVTPAKNHTPEADDGDCTTAVNCTVCGKVITPANSHTPEEDDGDCTTAVNCTVCGTVVEPARAAHSGGNATCSTLASCEVCGTKYGSLLSNNHEQTAEWHKDADSHYSIYNCCGKYYQSEAPHDWKNGVCDTEGCGYACQHPDMTSVNTATTHTYTCGICDYSVTEGHSLNDTVIEPTCTTGGYTTHKCECGYEYTDSKTEATGHDWSGLDGVCATCSAKCSHPEERAVEGKEPTCNEGGYTGYHHCDACGADYDKEELEALPHNYGFDAFSISPNPNADTTEPGTKIYLKYSCTNEGCHDEKLSIPVGVKLNDSQKQLTLKVIVVVLALIVVFWAWRALKAPATTTPWWRRRR